MKTLHNYILAALVLLTGWACEKEGDLVTLSPPEEGTLIATATDVVLSPENSTNPVLGLSWTTTELTVSDPNMSAPKVLKHTLQTSLNQDFSGTVVAGDEEELSRSYLGAELNALAQTLGTTPGSATAVYFRVRYSVGANIDPVFSNTVAVNLTSYEIDMSMGYILNADQEDTGVKLFSANSDGRYVGFMGATAWSNFFLKEGDGVLWGNDGVSGTAFITSSDTETHWNCWFPGVSGCYYVDFNTQNKTWQALLLPTLTVSGDVSGELTFDRPNNKWVLPFSTGSTSITVQLSTTGKQYNNATGTDDDAAVDTPVAFVQDGEVLKLGTQPGNITLSVPAGGDYTLTLDLSDPTAWVITAEKGNELPKETIETLYLPGIDDLISGGWTFDNMLHLYNEDDSTYAGVALANSEWGYAIHTEKDNWDDKYTLAEGDGTSGTLEFKGSTNLPAPAPGLYLFDVSLSALTYNLYPIEDQIYLSGLNNVWDFNTTLAATETSGEFSGSIVITQASEWGFQIHTDTSWNHYFGGSEGALYFKGSNITDDAALAPGTYTMTVNVITRTYSISN